MRNLKRVLSLALASAMLLGMMVIGAGAASKKASDLTDISKVTNKEAVNLMVDLGIIVGKPDGSFAPTETIDRATMSKLIYFILMGTADETAFKGISTPLKDVKGNWAEGFINYCYSVKIVAGTGDNTYNPNGKVTVVSAAKMLLVALGYDSKLSKYENDAMWSINIMRDAQVAGLLDNVNQRANEDLTRDNAAQMIYNALFAKTVTPIVDRDMGVAYLEKNEPKATTLGQETYKLFKGTAVVDGIDTDGTIVSNLGGTVAYKSDLEKMTATTEMLGNSVNVYYKSAYTIVNGAVVLGSYDKMISSVAFAAASKVISTTNDGTKLADLTAKGNKKYVGDLDTPVSYFLNGGVITPANVAAFDTSYAKAGIIIELINNDSDAAIDVVKVTQKTVRTLTGNAETKAVSGADTQVKVPGVINAFSSTNTVKNVVGYEGLKKDDVVLTYTFGTITYIEKAATIEGTVAARNSANKLSIGGTYYGGSGLNGFDTTTVDFENTYVFYLDNSNSIVKADKKTDNASANYVFVLETGWVAPTGGVDGAAGYAQARLMNADGTTQVVTISKVGGDKVNDASTTPGTNIKYDAVANTFYTYTVDTKGKYELTLATAKSGITSANAAQAAITGNTAKFDGTNIANSSTVFLVKSGTTDAPVYKAYTGIANLPSMALKTGALAAKSELIIKNSVVTYAFLDVTEGTISGEVGEYFYVIANSAGSLDYVIVPKSGDVPQHNTVKAIVNGESVTAKVADGRVVVTGSPKTALAVNTMYKVVSKDINGIITEMTAVTTGTAAGDVRTGVKLAGDTLIAGTSTEEVVTVNSSTEVFYITKDGVSSINYADIQSDKTDKVMIAKKDSKGYAQIVYVIDVIETSADADTITYKVDGTGTTTGTITWTTTGGHDGSTIAKAKQYTLTVSGGAAVVAAKDFALALNAVSAEADVALVSGTVPAKTAAAGQTLGGTLVYQVTAENGTTICYYEITLAVTSIAP